MGIIAFTDIFPPPRAISFLETPTSCFRYIWPVLSKNFAKRPSVLRPDFNIFPAIVLHRRHGPFYPKFNVVLLFGDFNYLLINVFGKSTPRCSYCINLPRNSPNKFADKQKEITRIQFEWALICQLPTGVISWIVLSFCNKKEKSTEQRK